jgi:hypothetical protein
MRRLLITLLALAACPFGGIVGAATAQDADVDYSRDPRVAVITWTETSGEIANPDPKPRLVVYGDGRAVAHYPHYMKHAGDHERQLSAAEMNQLVRGLVQQGLVEFDRGAARSALRAAAARGVERVSTDPSTTVIELRLSRYRPPGAVADDLDVRKRVEWQGLRGAARDYPSVRAIRDLAAAQRDLDALATRAASDSP